MIKLQGVCKRYTGSRLPLLDDVDLRVRAGESVVISGPCGGGKSTLLRLLYRDECADAGTVKVFDHDVRRLRESSVALLRRRLGIVTQDLHLLGGRTALANVELPLEVLGLPRRDARIRAARALGDVGLAFHMDEPLAQLSRGQRQRVALARALVGEPSLLVIDEPTAHLGNDEYSVFADLIDEFIRGEGAVVMASNDPRTVTAAIARGWGHVQLRDGRLHDPFEDENDGSERSFTQHVDGADSEHNRPDEPLGDDNVVPFPAAAGGGSNS